MLGIFSKKKYMGWKEYNQRIRMMDDFFWSQKIRRRNISNLGM